ncbi:PTS glucose transporter subunit IIABC [Vibrio tarriae]|uniref:PTS glucose transporter subunit IIABC n=1 Tax=Vibrio tarriae TaxID=2014742 RepID=A0AAU8WSH8_9VIBR|nr:PTS glucose transporter subunit IIABC [Vibrio tarriae]QEO45449.1 PTS glucose transporter subunit IIABC [Vibrio cholerae]ASK54800.1 PTS glucose transporter subunit IIABC [Vibrio tarriae]RBM25393.1 PTS glucose transporter subunit IIABC [Vibrio tarriae]RBM30025.1 PTS glucose transporter subunit IIABC [Vibrio tarriae]RBM36144.1 PTS glucose transporter subunit IIABC [Vibrio tarriae]
MTRADQLISNRFGLTPICENLARSKPSESFIATKKEKVAPRHEV